MSRRRSNPVWKLVALWVGALTVIVFAIVDVMPQHSSEGPGGTIASPTTPGVTASGNAAAHARRSAARARASASASAKPGATGNDLLATLNEATLSQDQAVASVGAVDLQTGKQVAWQSPNFAKDTPAYMASTAKLFIAEGLLLQKQDTGETLDEDETDQLDAMITVSDNDCADALYDAVGESAWPDLLKRLGLTSTVLGDDGAWGLTETTVADQLQVLANLSAANSPLNEASRTQILDLMGEIASDQDWGVSAAGSAPQLKNGWLPLDGGEGWVINSMGFVTGANGHRYELVVISNGWQTQDEGIEAVQDLAQNLVKALGG